MADHLSSSVGESLDTALSVPGDGVAVLTVGGEVDTLTAPLLTIAVEELTDRPEGTLVVDLTGVRFLASSGLAVLIQAAHRAEQRGVRLRVVAATRAVRRPLEITGTDQLFDVYDDPTAAAAAPD